MSLCPAPAMAGFYGFGDDGAVSQAYSSDVSVTLHEGHTRQAGFGGFSGVSHVADNNLVAMVYRLGR